MAFPYQNKSPQQAMLQIHPPGQMVGAAAQLDAKYDAYLGNKTTEIPLNVSSDPISNLIAVNARLQSENLTLRNQIYELERRGARGNLPEWGFDHMTGTFSLMGLLVIRMQRLLLNQPMFHDGMSGGKFSYKNVIFFDAMQDGVEPNSNVAVFIAVNGKPLLLQDQLALFPSDGFITKILTLTGDQPTEP